MTPLDLQAGAKRLRDAELPLIAPCFQPLRLSLVGGLPASAMPGERPRRWGPDPVTEASIKETHTLPHGILSGSGPGAIIFSAQRRALPQPFDAPSVGASNLTCSVSASPPPSPCTIDCHMAAMQTFHHECLKRAREKDEENRGDAIGPADNFRSWSEEESHVYEFEEE